MTDPADKRPPGQRPASPDERATFAGRISDLGDKLGKVKAQRDAGTRTEREADMRGRGMAYGMRMAAELVAAVIIGGLMGYGLDRWLGTTPWLFLLFFVLGFAAGVLNVVRAYERMQKEFTAMTGGKLGQSMPDDED
jgi:ATP synthase protein I